MIPQEQIIENCKNLVLNNKKITKLDVKILFGINDKLLKNLSDAANEITRSWIRR